MTLVIKFCAMLNITAHIIGLLQAFSFMLEAVLTCLVVPSYPFRFRNATLENRIEVLGTWSGDSCWPGGLLHEGGRGAGQPLHPRHWWSFSQSLSS